MPICISWLQQKILKPIGKTHLIFKSSRWEQKRLCEDICIFYYNVERGVLMCIDLNLYSVECHFNLNLMHISSCFNIPCHGFCDTRGKWMVHRCMCLGSQVVNVLSTPMLSKATSSGLEDNPENFAQPGFALPLVYMRVQPARLSMIHYTTRAVCRTHTTRRWHKYGKSICFLTLLGSRFKSTVHVL